MMKHASTNCGYHPLTLLAMYALSDQVVDVVAGESVSAFGASLGYTAQEELDRELDAARDLLTWEDGEFYPHCGNPYTLGKTYTLRIPARFIPAHASGDGDPCDLLLNCTWGWSKNNPDYPLYGTTVAWCGGSIERGEGTLWCPVERPIIVEQRVTGGITSNAALRDLLRADVPRTVRAYLTDSLREWRQAMDDRGVPSRNRVRSAGRDLSFIPDLLAYPQLLSTAWNMDFNAEHYAYMFALDGFAHRP